MLLGKYSGHRFQVTGLFPQWKAALSAGHKRPTLYYILFHIVFHKSIISKCMRLIGFIMPLIHEKYGALCVGYGWGRLLDCQHKKCCLGNFLATGSRWPVYFHSEKLHSLPSISSLFFISNSLALISFLPLAYHRFTLIRMLSLKLILISMSWNRIFGLREIFLLLDQLGVFFPLIYGIYIYI